MRTFIVVVLAASAVISTYLFTPQRHVVGSGMSAMDMADFGLQPGPHVVTAQGTASQDSSPWVFGVGSPMPATPNYEGRCEPGSTLVFQIESNIASAKCARDLREPLR